MPRRAQHVDADVRVARMHRYALVLLVPLVHAVPVERGVLAEVERILVRLRVAPDGIRRATVADDDVPVAGRALPRAEADRVDRLQELGPDVGERQVVDGQMVALQQQQGVLVSATTSPAKRMRIRLATGSTATRPFGAVVWVRKA